MSIAAAFKSVSHQTAVFVKKHSKAQGFKASVGLNIQVPPSRTMRTIRRRASGNPHINGDHYSGVRVRKDCGGIDYHESEKSHNRTI